MDSAQIDVDKEEEKIGKGVNIEQTFQQSVNVHKDNSD